MLSYLLPETDTVEIVLRLFIDFLGLCAAWAAGKSFASSWSPLFLVLPSSLALAAGLHFLHYSLFTEDPQSGLYYYGVTWLAVLIFATLGYRAKRALQMGSQYRWLFHTEGMFWTPRPQV
jgi:hypothetical protein